MHSTFGWTITDWNNAYRRGLVPKTLLQSLLQTLDQDDPAWIAILDNDDLDKALEELARTLAANGGDHNALPLYGIPFAVKDNTDVVGFETTAGCPAYAYRPDRDATVVAQLKAAGAVVIGKSNLDQFATGLVGVRSPYGAVPNSFVADVISGGSSSGSASLVARGLVPFALGSDTAGSGRIPAGLNNVVGLKPTRGACSIAGVVPACRSLDCVSVFALTVADAACVYRTMRGVDPGDVFSRSRPPLSASDGPAIRRPGTLSRLAIPDDLSPLTDTDTRRCWQQALASWQKLDVALVPVDFHYLYELASLLYDGPWIAERHATLEPFMASHSGDMHPVVRSIIERARDYSATDTFKSQYRRMELIQRIDQQLAGIDGLLVPTVPFAPTIAEVEADPVALNSRLGRFSNFVNLADFCALSVPSGFREDGVPFGLTLISGAWRDEDLQALASRWLNANNLPLGATDRTRAPEPLTHPCASAISAEQSPDRSPEP